MLTGVGEQLPENIDIGHHSNTMFVAEVFNCERTKMADISYAENVCPAVGCRVEDGIVVRIELDERLTIVGSTR